MPDVVRANSDLRFIAPPDAPPLIGAQALTLGKKLLGGVIQLAREVASGELPRPW